MPIGFCDTFSSDSVAGSAFDWLMESGKRALTVSLRLASQGVRNEVDSSGGELTGVVRRIWTASFSHLSSQLSARHDISSHIHRTASLLIYLVV